MFSLKGNCYALREIDTTVKLFCIPYENCLLKRKYCPQREKILFFKGRPLVQKGLASKANRKSQKLSTLAKMVEILSSVSISLNLNFVYLPHPDN